MFCQEDAYDGTLQSISCCSNRMLVSSLQPRVPLQSILAPGGPRLPHRFSTQTLVFSNTLCTNTGPPNGHWETSSRSCARRQTHPLRLSTVDPAMVLSGALSGRLSLPTWFDKRANAKIPLLSEVQWYTLRPVMSRAITERGAIHIHSNNARRERIVAKTIAFGCG